MEIRNMRTHDTFGGAMQRHIVGLLAVGLVLSSASGVMAYSGSYSPGAGINNTVHDLGSAHNGMNYTASPADPLNRICIFCHAPHNTYRLSTATGGAGPLAPPEYDYLPLWNHTLPDPYVAYTMYDNGPGAPQSGPKASQAILLGMTPGSVSLLCLSCHDGSIAVNSYGNDAQLSKSTGSNRISTTYVIGQDKYLGNHHPIGFDYDAVQAADIEIRNADTAMLTPASFVRDHLYTNGSNMECATCHSVHNNGNTGETLLWRSDQNSELCLTCHDKGIYTAP
jgi:predicted CXXCH cytochrome family protein